MGQRGREHLGLTGLEPITPEVGRPFYRAITTIDALDLIETPPTGTVRRAVRILCKGGDGGTDRCEIRRFQLRIRESVAAAMRPSIACI